MPVCTHCGHDTAEPEARFCAACGQPLAAPAAIDATSSLALGRSASDTERDEPQGESAEDAELIERLEPNTALLVVRRGPSAGARFLLDSDVTTVGRHPDSHIFFDDVTVSRRHAEFRRSDAAFVLHDVGSLNGTYINRKRIDDAQLVSGDQVQIGKYRLVFLAATTEGIA